MRRQKPDINRPAWTSLSLKNHGPFYQRRCGRHHFNYRRVHVPLSQCPRFLAPSLTKLNSGGLEILFSNERKHNITLPARLDDASQPTIAYLLQHLVDNLMKDDRKELFIMEDNVYARSILDLELCYVMY